MMNKEKKLFEQFHISEDSKISYIPYHIDTQLYLNDSNEYFDKDFIIVEKDVSNKVKVQALNNMELEYNTSVVTHILLPLKDKYVDIKQKMFPNDVVLTASREGDDFGNMHGCFITLDDITSVDIKDGKVVPKLKTRENIVKFFSAQNKVLIKGEESYIPEWIEIADRFGVSREKYKKDIRDLDINVEIEGEIELVEDRSNKPDKDGGIWVEGPDGYPAYIITNSVSRSR